MSRSDLPSSMVAREELEQTWRLKIQQAQKIYQVATERYKKLLEESEGSIPTRDSPLVLARRAQSLALEEFKHLLEIFTDFTVTRQALEAQAIPMEFQVDTDKCNFGC